MKKLILAIVAAGFVLAGPASVAQDGHYWTQQYGTKSMLLSGSVIGGVDDLGAVYYNPARLSQIENPAFLLSASVYEYNSISVTDAFGAKKSVSKSDIKGVPTLAAGTFKIKWLPKHRFAYAIMNRQLSDIGFDYANEVENVTLGTQLKWFSGEFSITGKANEQWMGLTWSYPLSSKFSVGVTTNFVSNNQTKGSNIELRALSVTDSVAMYQYRREYNYQETGLLWKIGVAGTLGKWSLGLTIKTPMLRFGGKGSYNYQLFYSSLPHLLDNRPPADRPPETYTTSSQENLEVKSKSPVAIGLGITRPIGKSKIHFSTEWYSGISKYTLMSATPHTSQSNPSTTVGFNLTDEFKSVWNAGLGVEYYISEHVSGYASFSTDFSNVPNDITRFIERTDEAANNSWKADFYNWGGGVVLDFKGADVTLGVTHTGAQQKIPRLVNFPDSGTGSGGPIFDPTTQSDLKWDRWRLVFSFSFPFLADYAKRMQQKAEGK